MGGQRNILFESNISKTTTFRLEGITENGSTRGKTGYNTTSKTENETLQFEIQRDKWSDLEI